MCFCNSDTLCSLWVTGFLLTIYVYDLNEFRNTKLKEIIYISCGATAQIWCRQPRFEVFKSHNQTHTHTHIPGRTPLNGLLTRCGEHYLRIIKQTQKTDVSAVSGIRNRRPSNQAATDLNLRPHSHRNRKAHLLLQVTSDSKFRQNCFLAHKL